MRVVRAQAARPKQITNATAGSIEASTQQVSIASRPRLRLQSYHANLTDNPHPNPSIPFVPVS
ncbi:hypothetical protein K491DRAFT_692775 [Lophiostoma macrostomum CBS 122681]|uniref:Uncharacterized protein n=1 Tax=Lophiostoma macrostomum CBS 122681 TaxID=1314788 RepID=A0A6A6T7C2_9PLEO|nr:hypothetical protein K491DRAFT_692775 [Lophiostoma macrostomum CBS 122681]